MKISLLNLIVFVFLFSCKHTSQKESKTSEKIVKVKTNQLNADSNSISKEKDLENEKKILIDTLEKYAKLDSCEFFYENGVVKTGYFLKTGIKYGVVCINNYKLVLFEFYKNEWNLVKELNYQMDYRGIQVRDINGDKKTDLIFPYFYVYSNTNYLVFHLINNKGFVQLNI